MPTTWAATIADQLCSLYVLIKIKPLQLGSGRTNRSTTTTWEVNTMPSDALTMVLTPLVDSKVREPNIPQANLASDSRLFAKAYAGRRNRCLV